MLPPSPVTRQKAPRRLRRGEYLVVLVVLVYAAVLLLGPVSAVVVGAFSEGLAVFWEQVTRPDALHSLQLTLALGLAATVINTVFGVIIAWVLVRDDLPGRKFLNGVIDLPFAVSPVVVGLMLILLVGRGGWLTPAADALGVRLLFSWPGMLLATLFVSMPFVVREVAPVLSQIGLQQEQAAYTMGASRWQAFVYVTFPAIRWGLFYGVVLTLARALGEFGAVLVVSGGVSGLTETSTLYIFRSLDDRNYVGADAMAFLLAVLSFSILMAMEFLKRRQMQE